MTVTAPTTERTFVKPVKFRVRDYNAQRIFEMADAEGITPTELLNRILDREFKNPGHQ